MANDKERARDNETTAANDNTEPSLGTSQPTGSDQAAELVELREKLEATEKSANENYDRYLRKVAELDNFKRRASREKEEAIRFANETLVRDILPVVDNLERAIAHSKGGSNGEPLMEGVEMVLRGLFDVLAKYGVIQVSALGEPFDPGKHEAMAQVESGTHPPNTVVEEYHKGYLLRDRLLRPALVSVAKAPESQGKKNVGNEVENDPRDD
jgi:molecular chaperone GrpE